jgi:hypothetical protein
MKSVKQAFLAVLALVLTGCPGGPTISAVSLEANPLIIEPGGTSSLKATVSGTGAFDPGVSWSIVSGGGTLSATSGATVTYSATGVASNTDVVLKAVSTADSSKTASLNLKVLAKPAIASFIASQSVLGGGGGSINLSWNVSGAESLSIDQGVGVVTGSLKTVNVTKSTRFTLTASNGAGSSTATVTVTVTALGTLDWKKQLGTSASDRANGVATDSSGNVFMAGFTSGAISGRNAGDRDAFVVRYK